MKHTIPVTRSSMPPFDEYAKTIRVLWESRHLTNMGAIHELFCERLKEYLDAVHCLIFNNGHIALEMGIQAMGLSGEVITTPFTFASTTHAIVRNGLTPVFCDIDPVSFNIDPQKIEDLITEKTTAITAVHVYGIPCDTMQIERIAKKYNLKVLYDAAHAFGVRYLGQAIADFGDLSMFSFHATKVFHSVEGGCAIVHDNELANILASLRNFGLSGDNASTVGGNGKMSEFHAAMGLCNLTYLDDEINKRRIASERYDECLKNINGLQLFPEIDDLIRNYAYYPVKVLPYFGMNRDEVAEHLSHKGIIVRKYFYPLTSAFDCYKGLFSSGYTPIAEETAESVLCLPLYADITTIDIDNICKALCSAKKGAV